MIKKIFSRQNVTIFIFTALFVIMAFRLAELTLKDGEYFYEQSVNARIREIETVAKRGEIYDRNGKVLATNKASFEVKMNSSFIPRENFNNIAIRVYDILNSNNEDAIYFPIKYENGKYFYTFDQSIEKWLSLNNFPLDATAEEVFNLVCERELVSEELDKYDKQKFLILKGIYLPISVLDMSYNRDLDKRDFLNSYGFADRPDISAEEAFNIIRERRDFYIDEDYTPEEAYKIMTYRHAVKMQGYMRYASIDVARNVSVETAIQLTEEGMSLPGISIEEVPIRYYPYGATLSHVLGYMGSIAYDWEIEKYVNENGYSKNQLIGKTGIEKAYELVLKGQNGNQYVEADALGRRRDDVTYNVDGYQSKQAVSGENVTLTIDIDLQKNAELYLEKAINAISTGGTYESKWGDYTYKETFPNAKTGAAVVVNVNTGEVLAMASYPDYDVNLFADGISEEDWSKLNLATKNPLAPQPLYNNASLMRAQPGSIYKMITVYTAVENGLDPNLYVDTHGFIEVGDKRFGCWIYNDFGGNHGAITAADALAVSCNYFMYEISTGFDFLKEAPYNFDMNAEKLLDETLKFGLDESTGIEIEESRARVPSTKQKKANILYFLERKLKADAEDFFTADIWQDDDKLSEVISEIISWSDDPPERYEMINRIWDKKWTPTFSIAESLADTIKYSYFNMMDWRVGDTFNLSIGQGDHAYTPTEIARYIASIANGGTLLDLSLVKEAGGEVVVKNQDAKNTLVEETGALAVVQEGMRRATGERVGTVSFYFDNFPMKVAGKTGTAEKQGWIPLDDEVSRIIEKLAEINVDISQEELQTLTINELNRRSNELAALQKQASELEDGQEKTDLNNEITNQIKSGYLEEGSAMRSMIIENTIDPVTNKPFTDEKLDTIIKEEYDSYGWFVSYAPYENPEIAVVVVIPQSGHGGYVVPVVRDLIGDYFNLSVEE